MKCQYCNEEIYGGNFCTKCGAPVSKQKGVSVLGVLAIALCATFVFAWVGLILGVIDLAIKDGKNKVPSIVAVSLVGAFTLMGFLSCVSPSIVSELHNNSNETIKIEENVEHIIEMEMDESVEDEYEFWTDLKQGEVGKYGRVVEIDGEEEILYYLPAGKYKVVNNGRIALVIVAGKDAGESPDGEAIMGANAQMLFSKGHTTEIEMEKNAYVILKMGADVTFILEEKYD